ncbi:MAG: AAA family ATPase, partial [Planctomycetaceae bacterium]
ISVLSGGERARLCLAGLMLSQHNVLVLDEPGNHLDVDTVEALADALREYQGTVVFTSHDRHFMQKIATSVIEVRDGRVTNYRGNYEAYLYAVNKEIDDGERENNARMAKAPSSVRAAKSSKPAKRNERDLQKEMTNVERTIARLDAQKKEINAKFTSTTDPAEAMRLHEEVTALSAEIAAAEERWCELQEELGDSY